MYSVLGLTTAVCFPERLCTHIGTDVDHKVEVHRRVKGNGDKEEKQATNRRSKSTGRIRERSPKLAVSDGSQTYEEKLDKGSATHLEQGVGEPEKTICELTVVVEEDPQSTSEKNLSKNSAERALSKLPKASRIPRTKSFNEGKSKC